MKIINCVKGIYEEDINMLLSKLISLKIDKFNQIEDVYLENNSNLKYPFYRVEEKKITLTIKKFFSPQVIYQLSHEVMHHIIYQLKGKTKTYDGKVSKATESFCTAFSFFIINEFGWDEYLKNEIKGLKEENTLYYEYRNEIFFLFEELKHNPLQINKLIYETIKKWNLESGKS